MMREKAENNSVRNNLYNTPVGSRFQISGKSTELKIKDYKEALAQKMMIVIRQSHLAKA